MSATNATPAGDRLDACDRLSDLAFAAVQDADDLLDAGDRSRAAIRLVEASDLYRLAARQLDPDIGAR